MDMKEPLIVLTSWDGAQYIDVWLLVHLLAGVALGYGFRVFGFSFLSTFIIVFFILGGWEIYEWVAKIPEPWTNSILDMVVGILGIWISYHIYFSLSLAKNVTVASLLLIVWGTLGIWGWHAWKERENIRHMTSSIPDNATTRLP